MKEYVSIAGKKIGNNFKPYIIAEIGLNHNHDIDLAKKLVKSAKENGADAVKFQTYITEKLVLEKSDAFSLFKGLELNKKEFGQIASYCKEIGITFISTPFCEESVDLLEELDVPVYKIASMDIDYYELIRYIAVKKKPIILSTGMSLLSTIEKAVNTIVKSGNDNIVLLHTISKYPPKESEMDLRMIERLKSMFDFPIGFSDHSIGNTMSIAARVLGATIFERHFTLDKKMKGPDHSISIEPKELFDLRNELNRVDAGLKEHKCQRPDLCIEEHARRSLYAAKDLEKGTVIKKDMIAFLRPAAGISPEYFPIFLDRELKKDLKKGDLFDLSCI